MLRAVSCDAHDATGLADELNRSHRELGEKSGPVATVGDERLPLRQEEDALVRHEMTLVLVVPIGGDAVCEVVLVLVDREVERRGGEDRELESGETRQVRPLRDVAACGCRSR